MINADILILSCGWAEVSVAHHLLSRETKRSRGLHRETLPSSYEALPYVTLEAKACGTPPVVSAAVPEEVVINSYNGMRVRTLDPRDYAVALERLLTDQELWLKLSRNG